MATPGLPTVAAVRESEVTLRRAPAEWLDAQILPDLGDLGGPDMLLEPEMPAREIEAALQEGRRHTAPIELITQREQPAPPRAELGIGEDLDAFGAPSMEEHLLMDAVQASGSPQRSPHPLVAGEEPAPGRPSIDQLLGRPGSDGQGSVLASGDLSAGGLGEAQPAPPGDAGAGGLLPPEVGSATPPQPPLARALEFEGLSGPRSADDLSGRAAPPPGGYLARLLEASPEPPTPRHVEEDDEEAADAAEAAEDALALLQHPPAKRRRRVRPWLDEATQIPTEVYHDTSAITRTTLLDYTVRLPHRSPQSGITTTLGDLAPLLCELLRRAPAVGEMRRRALAGIATPPRGADAADREADMDEVEEPLDEEDVEPPDDRFPPGSPLPDGAATGLEEEEDASPMRSPEEAFGLRRGSLGTPLGHEPGLSDEAATGMDVDVGAPVPEAVRPGGPGEPLARRRRTGPGPEVSGGGPVDDYPGLEYAAVSRLQEAELKSELGGGEGAGDVSFLGLCKRPPGGAEAAAQRFLSLLSRHMEGAVTLKQDEPYGDILIGRGPAWSLGKAEDPAAVVACA